MTRKIGILTHYYKSRNIGGLLQAYALPQFLNNCGYKAEQITFDFKKPDSSLLKHYRVLFPREINLKKILKYPFYRIKCFLMKCLICRKINLQNHIFEEFEQFIAHSAQNYNNGNIYKANADYDIFITGSDQVFAGFLLPFSAYYGEFAAPNKKIISYGASSDVKNFPPKAEKLFIKKLQKINKISVREETLKKYIEHLTGKEVKVVLDSTFLLPKEHWLKIANPEIVPEGKYIFCYFLGGKCAWQRNIAQSYADKYGYKIVHLPYIMQSIRKADMHLKGPWRCDIGPREFISLINGAECVFTDSFHGMAFALNFNKNFYVFNRDDENGPASMNARITDILEMLGLNTRHITDRHAVLNNTLINYAEVNKILEGKKQESITWLLNALES